MPSKRIWAIYRGGKPIMYPLTLQEAEGMVRRFPGDLIGLWSGKFLELDSKDPAGRPTGSKRASTA